VYSLWLRVRTDCWVQLHERSRGRKFQISSVTLSSTYVSLEFLWREVLTASRGTCSTKNASSLGSVWALAFPTHLAVRKWFPFLLIIVLNDPGWRDTALLWKKYIPSFFFYFFFIQRCAAVRDENDTNHISCRLCANMSTRIPLDDSWWPVHLLTLYLNIP
jgi:hypothetical protein